MECKKAMSINPTSPYNYKSVQPTQAVPVANRNSSPVPTVARPPAQTKKNEPSFSLPWALAGMATLLVGIGVVAFRKDKAKQIEKLPETLEAIFGKSYTPEETKGMVTTYQDLMKIEDQKTFIERAYQQIKMDMGLEDVKIPLKIIKTEKGMENNTKVGGRASWVSVSIAEDVLRHQILDSIAHELNHVRQNRELLQAGFLGEYVKDCLKKKFPKGVKNYKEIEAELCRELEASFSDIYGNVRKPSIQKGTPRYQKAEEYLKAHKSYDTTTLEAYHNNLLEIESHAVGRAMRRFVKTIKLYNL